MCNILFRNCGFVLIGSYVVVYAAMFIVIDIGNIYIIYIERSDVSAPNNKIYKKNTYLKKTLEYIY